MNYLFVYKYSKIQGGIQEIMRNLGSGLIQKDEKCNIYVLADHSDYKILNYSFEDGMHVYYLNANNILKVLYKFKIDVLCVFEPYKNYFYLTFLIKLLKRKIITNLIFCGSVSEYSNWIVNRITFVVVWLYDNLVAVSNYAKSVSLGGKYLDSINVIYNPVKINQYSISNFERYNILTIGRICSRKNYSDLIKMFNLVHKINPKIHLDIIGSYETMRQGYYDQIIKMVSDLSLKNCITFHGKVSEEKKIQLLSESRIYATTSTHEMFGITTVEAMASGLPIIAYNNSATKEVVNLSNGILVDDGRFDLMAKEVTNLIKNERKVFEMSKKSFEAAKQFNLDYFIDNYLNLFKTS
ncbi:glycosyltransferase family 4 protein [Patescibacteria group bacterium]|nr:glycosyltransferase family 4 protein [Patescibacteria group bacterium]MBU1952083.1 glycosyltransferase family 4 protein [Patescibacteria group bacterium]